MNTIQLAQEWKTLLCQLGGILSAHVVLTEAGTPEEVHVLATTDKKPKAVARDVQSALMSKYGVEVDHQIISVAQIRPEMAERLNFRLVMGAIEVKTRGAELDVAVELLQSGHPVVGGARGSNTPFSRRRCVAQAALDAVAKCVAGSFELAGVDALPQFGQMVLVTQIYCAADNQRYVGSAVAEADQDIAVVQSVLAALNRRIAVFPQGLPC
ncbi:MAG: hypothetical protein GXY32_04870 [Ruminococcaceae bacterium]|nr:hypothetical protein [Oscillospiraceae bacterium]